MHSHFLMPHNTNLCSEISQIQVYGRMLFSKDCLYFRSFKTNCRFHMCMYAFRRAAVEGRKDETEYCISSHWLSESFWNWWWEKAADFLWKKDGARSGSRCFGRWMEGILGGHFVVHYMIFFFLVLCSRGFPLHFFNVEMFVQGFQSHSFTFLETVIFRVVWYTRLFLLPLIFVVFYIHNENSVFSSFTLTVLCELTLTYSLHAGFS